MEHASPDIASKTRQKHMALLGWEKEIPHGAEADKAIRAFLAGDFVDPTDLFKALGCFGASQRMKAIQAEQPHLVPRLCAYGGVLDIPVPELPGLRLDLDYEGTGAELAHQLDACHAHAQKIRHLRFTAKCRDEADARIVFSCLDSHPPEGPVTLAYSSYGALDPASGKHLCATLIEHVASAKNPKFDGIDLVVAKMALLDTPQAKQAFATLIGKLTVVSLSAPTADLLIAADMVAASPTKAVKRLKLAIDDTEIDADAPVPGLADEAHQALQLQNWHAGWRKRLQALLDPELGLVALEIATPDSTEAVIPFPAMLSLLVGQHTLTKLRFIGDCYLRPLSHFLIEGILRRNRKQLESLLSAGAEQLARSLPGLPGDVAPLIGKHIAAAAKDDGKTTSGVLGATKQVAGEVHRQWGELVEEHHLVDVIVTTVELCLRNELRTYLDDRAGIGSDDESDSEGDGFDPTNVSACLTVGLQLLWICFMRHPAAAGGAIAHRQVLAQITTDMADFIAAPNRQPAAPAGHAIPVDALQLTAKWLGPGLHELSAAPDPEYRTGSELLFAATCDLLYGVLHDLRSFLRVSSPHAPPDAVNALLTEIRDAVCERVLRRFVEQRYCAVMRLAWPLH